MANVNIEDRKRVVMDVDGVLARKDSEAKYENLEPDPDVVKQLEQYQDRGYYVILYTARNMRSFDGRVGKINAHTAPTLVDWLDEHDISYDEIHYGKPWCGHDGFYVDDNAIRPSEFLNMDSDEIEELLESETRWSE